MKILFITFLLTICVGQIVYADTPTRPDGHAPIGVMGDHGHKKGELMLSYRYRRMEMDGNRSGSSNINTAEVLRSFPVSPLEMTMEMHMFGAMYGVGNNLTLMAMVPYVDKSMDLRHRVLGRFTTRSKGLGDAKIMGIYTLYDEEFDEESSHNLNLNLGLSLPTGDTDEMDEIPTPMGNRNVILPYPMQLGSGTYDPMMGITYTRLNPQWSWGLQFKTTQRLGKNDEGYRLGDEYHANTWVAYRHSDYLSASVRLNGKSWNNISGRHRGIPQMMEIAVPTARTDLRGGERAELGIGINFIQPHGMFKGHRLAAEFILPFYQHLDGPQLEVDYAYTLGWQLTF